MIPLQDRIESHRKKFDRFIMFEKAAEYFIKRTDIQEFVRGISPSTFSDTISIVIRVTSFEQAELDIVPRISGMLGAKWTKTVSEDGVAYGMSVALFKKVMVCLTMVVDISALPEGECKITPILTGKKIRDLEMTMITRDEVIYLVDCPEGWLNET